MMIPHMFRFAKDNLRAIKIKKAGGFVSEGETIIKPLKFLNKKKEIIK